MPSFVDCHRDAARILRVAPSSGSLMRIMVSDVFFFGNMRGSRLPTSSTQRVPGSESDVILRQQIKRERLIMHYRPHISLLLTTSYLQELCQYQHRPLGHLLDHLSVLVLLALVRVVPSKEI